jgi:hypothetical protein
MGFNQGQRYSISSIRRGTAQKLMCVYVLFLLQRDLYREVLRVCDDDIPPKTVAAEDSAAKARL